MDWFDNKFYLFVVWFVVELVKLLIYYVMDFDEIMVEMVVKEMLFVLVIVVNIWLLDDELVYYVVEYSCIGF